MKDIICKNCGGRLVEKATASNAAAAKKRLHKPYYYTAYYYCPHCKKLYHDEKFKVVNKNVSGSPTLFDRDSSASPRNDKREIGNDKVVEIWTDGACIYNGTPKARAAWAFVSGKTEKAGLLDGLQTNNRAEAFAIYHALVWAAEKKFRSVRLHTDSQISIHGVNKDPKKVLKNRDIFEQIAQVIMGCHLQVDFVKVLGHSGDVNNERVDKLANDMARNG